MTKGEFSEVEVEKVIKDKVSKEWKKPDINANFNEKRIAIELQLSTTWLDVITRRQHFYKEQGIYIFWVFHTFNENDDLRKLTFNDVIYTNNQNAYVFDKETYELSKSENDLLLKCFYKTYHREEIKLCEKWESLTIKFSDLTFDELKTRIYYHDTEAQKKKIEKEIYDYIFELQEAYRLKILEQQKQVKKQQEDLKRKTDLKDKVLKTKQYIKGIVEIKNEIIKIESRSKINLTELKDFASETESNVNKFLLYFADQQNSSTPFYNYIDLFNSLRAEFDVEVKTLFQSIKVKKEEEKIIFGKLEAIGNLPTLEILNTLYSIIDKSIYWSYIKNNYDRIKFILKREVNGLFPSEYLKSIYGEYELIQYQNAKDTYFLTDFSNRIKELNELDFENKVLIKQQEEILFELKEKIKTKIKTYIENKITLCEIDLKDNSDKIVELNKEIDKMEVALKQLE